jgi:hypothetical protein
MAKQKNVKAREEKRTQDSQRFFGGGGDFAKWYYIFGYLLELNIESGE